MLAGFVLLTAQRLFAQAPAQHASTPANVQSGTIAALDPAQEALSLRTHDGRAVEYRITPKTHVFRNKKPITVQDLKPGDEVVVRFRRSRTGAPSLYDVADRVSWEWILRLRSQITAITLTAVTDDHIAGTDSSGAGPIEYRVTSKTLWGKENKPAQPNEYTVGDRVYVAPRPLPSGGLMAAAVADTPAFAARLKERTRSTVTGTIAAVDPTKRELTLHTLAGDERQVKLAADCVVREAARDVKTTFLRPGLRVTVHLRRDAEGEQTATRITIQKRKTGAAASGSPARPLLKKH
ncbi:MAG: DUF5666 domain-containing protein [Chthonomonadales bacterium]